MTELHDKVMEVADYIEHNLKLSGTEAVALAFELTARSLGDPARPGYEDDLEFVLALFSQLRPVTPTSKPESLQ